MEKEGTKLKEEEEKRGMKGGTDGRRRMAKRKKGAEDKRNDGDQVEER